MQVILRFKNDDARYIKYFLRRRYKSKADLAKLAMVAIRHEVSSEAQIELNELNR